MSMNPWAVLGGVLLLICAWFGGSHFGAKLERAAWQKRELALTAAHVKELEKEIAARDRERLFSEAKARKASENHEKAITDLKAQYVVDVSALRAAGGLRIPKRACVPVAAGTESTGPGRLDEGAAATEALPERTQERLFQLTLRADELSEQLRALQGWIRSSGFYGQAP